MEDLKKNLKKIQDHLNIKDQKNILRKLEEKKPTEIKEGMDKINCKKCNDLRWVSLKNDNFKYVLCDDCEEKNSNKMKVEKFLYHKDLGDITMQMLKKMNFRTFKDNPKLKNYDDVKEASEHFLKNLNGWLLITGPTGVGKTHIATAIAGDRISKLKPVYFGFMPNVLERLRNFNDGQPNNFFNFLVEHPFLIIDDLGSQTNSIWAEEKIYQLIVSRHNNQLPTVITTRASNINEDLAFNPQINEAIISRLSDVNVVSILPIVSEDYRV